MWLAQAGLAADASLLLVVAALLALLWKPAAERAFVTRTEGLLREAERNTEAMATSLVNRAMEFAALSALAADEQRALGVEDLPLDLYTDAEGRLDADRLREGLRTLVADPGGAGGEKHAAVRAEILERTRGSVQARLGELRRTRGAAAAPAASPRRSSSARRVTSKDRSSSPWKIRAGGCRAWASPRSPTARSSP